MTKKITFKDKLIGCDIKLNEIANKTVMITGATGLIGKTLATSLLTLSESERLGIKLILPIRSRKRLCRFLSDEEKRGNVSLVECDLVDFNGKCEAVDYIIHCASITESKKMVENPVEVTKANVCGTINILEYAKACNVKSCVYLSSMEAYGFSVEDTVLSEEKMQYLNPLEVRSCYPESKRMAENICISYFSEYVVPTKIVRLAQTFGKGVEPNDKRVFAEFGRCAVKGQDIVLLTDGASARMYVDVEDAVVAILAVLLKGENGKAYNVANKDTYCSIAQMASIVAENIGKGKISVRHTISDNGVEHFSPTHKFYLDTSRIEQIGWKPYTDLIGMFKNMISDWNSSTL